MAVMSSQVDLFVDFESDADMECPPGLATAGVKLCTQLTTVLHGKAKEIKQQPQAQPVQQQQQQQQQQQHTVVDKLGFKPAGQKWELLAEPHPQGKDQQQQQQKQKQPQRGPTVSSSCRDSQQQQQQQNQDLLPDNLDQHRTHQQQQQGSLQQLGSAQMAQPPAVPLTLLQQRRLLLLQPLLNQSKQQKPPPPPPTQNLQATHAGRCAAGFAGQQGWNGRAAAGARTARIPVFNLPLGLRTRPEQDHLQYNCSNRSSAPAAAPTATANAGGEGAARVVAGVPAATAMAASIATAGEPAAKRQKSVGCFQSALEVANTQLGARATADGAAGLKGTTAGAACKLTTTAVGTPAGPCSTPGAALGPCMLPGSVAAVVAAAAAATGDHKASSSGPTFLPPATAVAPATSTDRLVTGGAVLDSRKRAGDHNHKAAAAATPRAQVSTASLPAAPAAAASALAAAGLAAARLGMGKAQGGPVASGPPAAAMAKAAAAAIQQVEDISPICAARIPLRQRRQSPTGQQAPPSEQHTRRQEQQLSWQQLLGRPGGLFVLVPEHPRQQDNHQQQQQTAAHAAGAQQGAQQQHRLVRCGDVDLPLPSSMELGDKFRVWPDLHRSSSNGSSSSDSCSNADFDLVPPGLCSPGVQPFMQQLIALTQPQGPYKPKGSGPGRHKKTQQQQQQQVPRTQRSKGGVASGDDAATRTRGRAANATATAAAALASYDSCGSQLAGVDLEEGLWVHYDDALQAVAAPEDEDGEFQAEAAWYAEAAQKQSRFTWQDAPPGQFYRLADDSKQPLKLWLVPDALMTRGDLDSKLWRLGNQTRVLPVDDPCHPCMRNPIRPVTMPTGQQYMLVARCELQKGELLGLYWGRMLTQKEDLAAAAADLNCAYGLRHAYNMIVAWSEGKVDGGNDDLLVVGDNSSCRMCLVNDVRSWAESMEAQGWGPCPQAARGTCRCSGYVDRSANVEWKHYVYRTLQGDYIPAVAAFAKTPVIEGAELLTSYEQGSAGFWDIMRANLAQCTFFHTMDARGKAQTAALQEMLQYIQSQPGNPAMQHLQQLAVSALQAATEQDAKLAVLLSQAQAMAQGQPVPEAVAAAWRNHSGAGT